jgi:hypothetical protein
VLAAQRKVKRFIGPPDYRHTNLMTVIVSETDRDLRGACVQHPNPFGHLRYPRFAIVPERRWQNCAIATSKSSKRVEMHFVRFP